nr:ORF2 [Torque teno felis virus]
MQPPAPGPNLLLPSLGLSGPPDLDHHLAYKRREAEWKRLVSKSHADWCLCGSYKNHFLPPDQSLKATESCTEGGESSSGAGDVDPTTRKEDFGDVISDEDIMAVGGEL